MLVLRVRCVDDGRELLVERHGADEHRIQVAELKKLVLQQRQDLERTCHVSNPLNPSSGLADWFVLLRGQILADPDVLDLNALTPSDFFVFASDTASSEIQASSGSGRLTDDATSERFHGLRSQLVDMGFSMDLAARALQKSGNHLSDAATLLVDGEIEAVDRPGGSMHSQTATELVAQYPAIAPLQGLLHEEKMKRLQQVAATDSFQALVLLKEQFSSDLLDRLNENPVATLQLLSLGALTLTTPSMAVEMEQGREESIDVKNRVETGVGDSKAAIDRLVAMGFARDLVKALYESCDGDEQLTANALLQTFES